MSSRALRRAQRELEQKRQLEQLGKEESEAESDEDETPAPAKPAPSMFALLGQGDDDQEDEDEDEVNPPPQESDTEANRPQPSAKKSKKKKKKKGKAGKAARVDEDEDRQNRSSKDELDEIDLALQSLSTAKSQSEKDDGKGALSAPEDAAATRERTELYSLLSIDPQHLHVSNEMRRLFGRAAIENDRPQDDAAAGRRRGRGGQQGGIAGAVAGRNMPGGRNLASLGFRKNIFIQGKEEWPRSTSGGLGMEVVSKNDDGTVEYRFVHNNVYQDVQRQFTMCVASMDPNRMVQLLQHNPYHISTLLQVSEIATHERDHATAGDLLERALFTFGRSVHSTFSSNISQGKARLDFRRPENREFWLAAWRYITNLGMRSTWRTAFEWAELLLSLDPDWDPYCICLIIDQFAIRARQPQKLLQLWHSAHFHSKWQHHPNIAMTAGLASVQSGSPSEGRTILREAIEQHPWVACRLFQELNIEPLPPKIWGSQPPNSAAMLFTELYATRAKDIWNTPEASSLLVEVAHAADPANATSSPAYNTIDPLDYSRHVILTDKPELIALLDRSMTSRLTSGSDPLPPSENITSYDASPSQSTAGAAIPSGGRASFLQTLMPWLGTGESDMVDPATGQPITMEEVVEGVERNMEERGGAGAMSLQELLQGIFQWAEQRRRQGLGQDDAEPDEEVEEQMEELRRTLEEHAPNILAEAEVEEERVRRARENEGEGVEEQGDRDGGQS